MEGMRENEHQSRRRRRGRERKERRQQHAREQEMMLGDGSQFVANDARTVSSVGEREAWRNYETTNYWNQDRDIHRHYREYSQQPPQRLEVYGFDSEWDQGHANGRGYAPRLPDDYRHDPPPSVPTTGTRGRPKRSKKVSIPENWADVPKIGAPIAASRFIAMRVPLDDKYTRLLPSPDDLWTPGRFLQTQTTGGYDVRLLIDLTNTTKYYDGEDVFRGSSLRYVKLPIEGFKRPPRRQDVDAFTRIVDHFVSTEPIGLVAVHCTHGLNRTGYLIVSYLVQRCGMTLQDALKAFADARPPGLIKHMYIEDLFRTYAPDSTVTLPQVPDWAAAKYTAR